MLFVRAVLIWNAKRVTGQLLRAKQVSVDMVEKLKEQTQPISYLLVFGHYSAQKIVPISNTYTLAH